MPGGKKLISDNGHATHWKRSATKRHVADVYAKGGLSHCKRRSIAVQKATFYTLKDGLLHDKKRPSANCLTVKRLAEGKKNGENFYSKLPPFLSTLTMKLFLL